MRPGLHPTHPGDWEPSRPHPSLPRWVGAGSLPPPGHCARETWEPASPHPQPANGNQMAGCLVSAWGAARTGEMGWGPGFQNPSPGRGRVRVGAPTSGEVLPPPREMPGPGGRTPGLWRSTWAAQPYPLWVPSLHWGGGRGAGRGVARWSRIPGQTPPPVPECSPSPSCPSTLAQGTPCHPRGHTGRQWLHPWLARRLLTLSPQTAPVSGVCVWHGPKFRP